MIFADRCDVFSDSPCFLQFSCFNALRTNFGTNFVKIGEICLLKRLRRHPFASPWSLLRGYMRPTGSAFSILLQAFAAEWCDTNYFCYAKPLRNASGIENAPKMLHLSIRIDAKSALACILSTSLLPNVALVGQNRCQERSRLHFAFTKHRTCRSESMPRALSPAS